MSFSSLGVHVYFFSFAVCLICLRIVVHCFRSELATTVIRKRLEGRGEVSLRERNVGLEGAMEEIVVNNMTNEIGMWG